MELLRIRDVVKLSGTCRATVYVWMRKGRFPLPIRTGSRTVAWRKADVLAWQASCESAEYKMHEGCVPLELANQAHAVQ